MLQMRSTAGLRPISAAAAPRRAAAAVVCRAVKPTQEAAQTKAQAEAEAPRRIAPLALSALVAGALLASAAAPGDEMAAFAARSGGRVGGSSFSARRSAGPGPARSARAQQA